MWAWGRIKWLLRQTLGGGAIMDLIGKKKSA